MLRSGNISSAGAGNPGFLIFGPLRIGEVLRGVYVCAEPNVDNSFTLSAWSYSDRPEQTLAAMTGGNRLLGEGAPGALGGVTVPNDNPLYIPLGNVIANEMYIGFAMDGITAAEVVFVSLDLESSEFR